MPQNLVYVVDPGTCRIEAVSPDVAADSGLKIHLTRKGAALFAYHLASEKINHWYEVRNAAWAVYVQESEKVTI